MPKATSTGSTRVGANPGSGDRAHPLPGATPADSTNRPTKKSEQVARTIAHELFTQQAEPGSLIDVEDDLVKRLGVSRGTLREGLRLLEVLGVVESRLGRSGGIAVKRPSPGHFAQIVTFYLQFSGCTYRQLLDVYAELSPIILRLVATDASDEQLVRLAEAMAQFEELPIDQQVRRTPSINLIYSDMVANPMWALLAKCFQLVIARQLETLLVPESEWPRVVRTVRRMSAAVNQHDADGAERLARAQADAWLKIARTTHRELLDTRIMWATGDDLFDGHATAAT